MKKLLIHILLILSLSATFSVNLAYAQIEPSNDRSTSTSPAPDTTTSTTQPSKDTFNPTIIPKPDTLPGPAIEGDTQRKTLTETILPRLAVGIIGFVGAASLVFLIIGGLRFAMAYGEDEAIEKGKKQITYAIIGFVLALLSYTIVAIITNLDFGGK